MSEEGRVREELEVAVQINTGDVKEALKANPEFLINFFLGDLLTCSVPGFHIEVFIYLITFAYEQFALAVPRGHAKTTLVKLAIIWYYLFSDIRFIVYCSNTTQVAKDECRDVINFLEGENFTAVFGMIDWEKKNESDGLYIFKIQTSPGKWKRCILRALGAGQQIRGLNIDNLRPQLLICDDAEDDENTETETQRKKFKRWVYGPLFKSCARHSKKVWIGNLVSSACLIGEFCESEYWHSVKYGCILASGEPLWPEMFDLAWLKEDFNKYVEAGMTAKWFAEMMNMPMPDGLGLIMAEQICYRHSVTPGDCEFGFITVDPAISKKTYADNTGIAVHGYFDEKWQIVEHLKFKADPVTIIMRAVELAFKWRFAVIGVETVAYQAALISIFELLRIQYEWEGIEVVELHASSRKVERIASWSGWLMAHNYALNEGDFEITDQLLKYDASKMDNDDDLIDACAYGPQVIAEHLNLLQIVNMSPDSIPGIKTLAQVARV